MNPIANQILKATPEQLRELSDGLVSCFLVANATDRGYVDATSEDVANYLTDWAFGHADASAIPEEH